MEKNNNQKLVTKWDETFMLTAKLIGDRHERHFDLLEKLATEEIPKE